MIRFSWALRMFPALTLVLLLSPAAPAAPPGQDSKEKNAPRPTLLLRAAPNVSFTPAKIFLNAELKGGADDYQEFYCAGVEWDWDDGTTSESQSDCEPYQAAKSRIQRRFSVQHVYKVEGVYRIQIRLMQKKRPVAAANATVQVNPGLGRVPD
jgi:hypothetical protein